MCYVDSPGDCKLLLKSKLVQLEYGVSFFTVIKGPRSRRRARAFFRILPAYTIIKLDHHGVVIKFQRSKYASSTGSLRLQVE